MARVETLGALNNEAFIQISSDCTNVSSLLKLLLYLVPFSLDAIFLKSFQSFLGLIANNSPSL